MQLNFRNTQDTALFRQLSRRSRYNSNITGTGTSIAWGDTLKWTAPKTGLLGKITLFFNNLNPTLTAPTGNQLIGIAPFHLIKRIRVYAGNNVLLWDADGECTFLHNMAQFQQSTAAVDPSQIKSTNNRALLYANPLSSSGAAWAATSYPTSFYLDVPIKMSNDSMLGLQPLNNPQNDITVEVTFRSTAEMGITGGTATALAGIVSLQWEIWTMPEVDGVYVLPDMTFAHIGIQKSQAMVGNANVIEHQVGNIFTGMYGLCKSDTSGFVSFTAGTIEHLQGQNYKPIIEPYWAHLVKCKQDFGIVLPDGCVVWNYLTSLGVPELTDSVDTWNTSEQAYFAHNFLVTATGTNPHFEYIETQLAVV